MIPIQLHHIWHHCIVPQKDSAFNISNCISQNTKWAINTSFPRPGHIYISLTVDNEEYLELIFDFNLTADKDWSTQHILYMSSTPLHRNIDHIYTGSPVHGS